MFSINNIKLILKYYECNNTTSDNVIKSTVCISFINFISLTPNLEVYINNGEFFYTNFIKIAVL